MCVRIRGVQPESVAVTGLRFGIPSEVMKNISEVEVGLEHVWIERDPALVERLRLRDLVARVVNVRQIDQSGNEIGINLKRQAVGP